ncbi:hypothetical protein ZIOFF_037188 [Zingiber officinale]|uniref:Uncharacterized protein n=1 Tax=Zingiber officinale TaxID=94328 RepID=A0A8J5GB74_ZINOF|nr:hypothetical protein ZIOFF_037188 [Zingiber officinale]
MKGSRIGGGVAVRRTTVVETVVEEEELSRRAPEIARLRHRLVEEKESLRRSIVHPSLKKSSSCNEERSSKASNSDTRGEAEQKLGCPTLQVRSLLSSLLLLMEIIFY